MKCMGYSLVFVAVAIAKTVHYWMMTYNVGPLKVLEYNQSFAGIY